MTNWEATEKNSYALWITFFREENITQEDTQQWEE